MKRSSIAWLSKSPGWPAAASLVVGLTLMMFGASAADAAVLATRPDGTTERLTEKGDPSFVYYQDRAGYSLMRVKDTFEYARLDLKTGHLVPSGHVWGSVDPATVGIPPGVRFSSRHIRGIGRDNEASGPSPQPALGEIPILVIPMRFSNHRDRQLPVPQTYDRILNREGGDTELAPAGSVRDYLREASYGKFTLSAHVLDRWVDLPQPESYYASWDAVRTIADGIRIDEACHYALGALDVDFRDLDLSQFDRNGDGYLDAVGFLHSGYGSEAGGTDPDGVPFDKRVHSMQYSLPEWTSRSGMKVRKVAVISGLFGHKTTIPSRVGVLAHEGLHMAGHPDLYDTESHYEARIGAGIGFWGILGDSWGVDRSQHYPLHLSAWAKTMLKWVEPVTIDSPGMYTARAVEKFPDIFKITHGFPPGEYLLIENRQPIGFDRQIPAGQDGQRGGLAIWHIDDRKTSNDDNGYPGLPGFPQNNAHQRVALLQADGRYDLERGARGADGRINHGDGDDLFRSTNATELGPGTVPDTSSYQLGVVQQTGVRIHKISQSAETMTFRVDFVPVEQLADATREQKPSAVRPEPPDGDRGSANAGTKPTEGGKSGSLRRIADLSFELACPSTVIISAEAVLKNTDEKRTVGLLLASAETCWFSSQRRATFTQSGQMQTLRTKSVQKLPAGRHDVMLVLNEPEGQVEVLPGGSLTHVVVVAETGTPVVKADADAGEVAKPAPVQATASQNRIAATTVYSSLTYIDLSAPPSAPRTQSPAASKPITASSAVGASSPKLTTPDENTNRLAWQDLGSDGAIKFDEKGHIAALTIDLPREMDVRISASMSFASPAADNRFVLSLASTDELGFHDWPDTRTRLSTPLADQCVIGESQTTQRLPQGKHTIFWRIEPHGDAPTFAIGGGLIMAELIPVSDE